MTKTLNESLGASLPEEPQDSQEEPKAHAAGWNDAFEARKRVEGIIGERDPGGDKLAISKSAWLYGTIAPLVIGFICEVMGLDGLKTFSYIFAGGGFLVALFTTLGALFAARNSTKREERAKLYDKLLSGELSADFHVFYKDTAFEHYLFIDKKQGKIYTKMGVFNLKDLHKASTHYKQNEHKTRHYLCLHIRNLDEPIQKIVMRNDESREQHLERLADFLGWN